jgi:SAM-dependent methyltransferase
MRASLVGTEILKRTALRGLTKVSRNPKYATLLEDLNARRHGDLARLANETGISLETLVHQRDIGLDNPAYRFERDAAFFAYFLAEANRLKGCSWLDVGANTGAVSLYLSEILRSTDFTLCDVHTPPRSNFPVRHIDGTRLDYPDHSVDLVLFSYVLHHAADNAIPLLRDARRIARRNVIVTEDPKETEADRRWAYQDDPGGTYRGLREWRALFILLGFSIVYEASLSHHAHSRHLFVLAPDPEHPA